MKAPAPKPITMRELDERYPTEAACKAALAAHRWPDGVRCPRCGNSNVYELPSKKWHWQCEDCSQDGYRFSVLVGTVFENTKYPLTAWFKVAFLMLSSKKGMSALQIQRMMGMGSYRTAWYMCHRIRAAMKNDEIRKLTGIVETDETYVGGKRKNRHKSKRIGPGSGGGTGSGKIPVIGAVQRDGQVVARMIDRADVRTVTRFVNETVSTDVSLLVSDTAGGYRFLNHTHPGHKMVNHEAGEYVIGAIHTNTIEGFWSIIKRGIIGNFHKVSKKYLPLYVAEFQFRHNNRSQQDVMLEKLFATCP